MCEAPICRCHEAPALKLEVGKTYISRNGKKVKIVSNESNKTYNGEIQSYIGVFLEENYSPMTFFGDGSYLIKTTESLCDLVKEYKEPDYLWFNLYKYSPAAAYHQSKKAAKAKAAAGDSTNLIGTYKINIDTGEIWKDG